MAFTALASPLLFAAALFALSALLTWLMMRANIMAVPNRRSSHRQPVPNSGGVAIVVTFFAGYAVVHSMADEALIGGPGMTGFVIAAAGIAAVGLADDFGLVPGFKSKLCAQILAAVILAASGIVFRRLLIPYVGSIELGLMAYPITVIWVVALANIINFMDGLDGLAGGTSVIVAAFFAAAAFLGDSSLVYALSAVILSSALGFVVFNFPRARIFMGDVGSQFLGFTFAAIAVIAAGHDASRMPFLIMPLLFFNFIFDTVFTFFRRLISGEDVTSAHRGHLYQLMNRSGLSHVRVSLFHYAVAALQGLGALALIGIGPDRGALVFLPFLAFQTVYAGAVIRIARRRGVLPE